MNTLVRRTEDLLHYRVGLSRPISLFLLCNKRQGKENTQRDSEPLLHRCPPQSGKTRPRSGDCPVRDEIARAFEGGYKGL
jgi:hypothetical protein